MDISGGSGGTEGGSVRLVGGSGSAGSGVLLIVSSGEGFGVSSLVSVSVSRACGASLSGSMVVGVNAVQQVHIIQIQRKMEAAEAIETRDGRKK